MRTHIPVDSPMQMALVACAADLHASEEIIGAAEVEREALFARSTPGRARRPRKLIASDQPETQITKPAEPQFPEVWIRGAAGEHRASQEIGDGVTPTQEAANSPREIKMRSGSCGTPIYPVPGAKVDGSAFNSDQHRCGTIRGS